jgi:hypothetical protein
VTAVTGVKKGKTVPLQAWSGPEGSRKLRFPDFMTTAQEDGKVVSLMHRLHLSPGNSPGTHFCSRLSRPQDHSAIRRIYVNGKFTNISVILRGNISAYIKLRFKTAVHFDIYMCMISEKFNTLLTVQTLLM